MQVEYGYRGRHGITAHRGIRGPRPVGRAQASPLSFGFADNAIHPAPLLSAGDDVSGAATPASVFVDAMNGDLHLKADGQAVDTGLGVFGLPAYGVVTTDIAQQLRPPQGPWDRGAFEL